MEIKNYVLWTVKFFVLLFTAAVLHNGCATEPDPVLWDTYQNSGSEVPVIQTVTPALEAWNLIDTITISGNYFSPDSGDMWVYLNTVQAEIISATPTQIQCKSPGFVADSVVIKVVKRTADKYASADYKIKMGFGEYYTFMKVEIPKAITPDKDGNIYVSMIVSNVGAGVFKISKDSLKLENYALKGTETSWTGLKFGGTQLYGAKNNKGIWKINPGVVPANQPWSVLDGNVNDMDFDQNGKMWAAGANIYGIDITTAAATKTALTSGNIKSVRVFQNYLYVGGAIGGKEGVWRYQITNGQLGPQEEYYNLADIYASSKVLAINFDADGTLYIGTDNANPIVTVSPAKAGITLYPGVIKTKAAWLAWAEGEFMLYVKDVTTGDLTTGLFKVHVNSVSAPYYGLTL